MFGIFGVSVLFWEVFSVWFHFLSFLLIPVKELLCDLLWFWTLRELFKFQFLFKFSFLLFRIRITALISSIFYSISILMRFFWGLVVIVFSEVCEFSIPGVYFCYLESLTLIGYLLCMLTQGVPCMFTWKRGWCQQSSWFHKGKWNYYSNINRLNRLTESSNMKERAPYI